MTTSSPPDVIDVIPVLKPEPQGGGPSWFGRFLAIVSRRRWPLLALLVLLALAVLVWRNTRPQPRLLTGQVEMQEIDIVAPAAGVLTRLLVQAGQQVDAGAPLFELDGGNGGPAGAQAAADAASASAASSASSASASASAAASPAQAAAASAADAEPASGATQPANTPEVIQARAELERSRVDVARFERAAELAYAAYQRAVGLFEDSMIESRARDAAQAQWNAADAQVRAARARLEQVRRRTAAVLAAAPQVPVPAARPPRATPAPAATAAAASTPARAPSVAAAAGAAAPGRATLRAPVAGEIDRVAVRAGVRVAAGQWLMSLLNPGDAWVVAVVREDVLPAFAFGTVHSVDIPVLSTRLELRVDSLTQLPDFATWRGMGGAELRSFEVRLRADKLPAGLRPGMAVLFAPR